jgi:hypothetical protein
MLVDDIADRIAIACPAEIDAIIKDMWVDHTHGLLTENEMEALDEAARARREAVEVRRQAARPGPAPRPGNAPRVAARPRRPRSPDKQASITRRRGIGQERWLPPNLASKLTQGEIAVASVMVREIVHHGVCSLPNDAIAALAGTCVTMVKNVRRLAEALGWITVIHRPRRGQKSLTNLIHTLNPELRAWIATRRRMIGGKRLTTTQMNMDSDTPCRREPMSKGGRKRLGDERVGCRAVP